MIQFKTDKSKLKEIKMKVRVERKNDKYKKSTNSI